jgi:hypothetical protein
MDTSSPPNNEAPATGKSRVSSKTNLNNGADIVTAVPRERKSKAVVFDHKIRRFWGKISEDRWVPYTKRSLIEDLWCEGGTKNEAAEAVERIKQECRVSYAGTLAGRKAGLCHHRGAVVLVTEDSPPLIEGHFPAVERPESREIISDADGLEQIAKRFEQLKGQLPPGARKIVESPSHEGLPKTGEVYYHRGSAGRCPRGYERVKFFRFYREGLSEFLQARYHEVRLYLECNGFASKRIAGEPSEVDQGIARIRRENCVDEVVEVGEAPGVIVKRRKRVLVLRGPAALENALWCLRMLKGGAR